MLPPKYVQEFNGDQLAVLQEAYLIACGALAGAGLLSEKRRNKVAVEMVYLMRRGVREPQRLASRSINRSI